MTHENRVALLTDSLVLKVQKDENWTEEVEYAIKLELRKVLLNWITATAEQGRGPREVILYLKKLEDLIDSSKIDFSELPESEE